MFLLITYKEEEEYKKSLKEKEEKDKKLAEEIWQKEKEQEEELRKKKEWEETLLLVKQQAKSEADAELAKLLREKEELAAQLEQLSFKDETNVSVSLDDIDVCLFTMLTSLVSLLLVKASFQLSVL